MLSIVFMDVSRCDIVFHANAINIAASTTIGGSNQTDRIGFSSSVLAVHAADPHAHKLESVIILSTS